MTLILNKVWFPPDQSSKVAKKYIEWMSAHPPDKTIGKNIFIGVTSDENGMILSLGVDEVMKGKEKEALQNNIQGDLFLASGIDGFRYKTEIILEFKEAYKILGMTAPEV